LTLAAGGQKAFARNDPTDSTPTPKNWAAPPISNPRLITSRQPPGSTPTSQQQQENTKESTSTCPIPALNMLVHLGTQMKTKGSVFFYQADGVAVCEGGPNPRPAQTRRATQGVLRDAKARTFSILRHFAGPLLCASSSCVLGLLCVLWGCGCGQGGRSTTKATHTRTGFDQHTKPMQVRQLYAFPRHAYAAFHTHANAFLPTRGQARGSSMRALDESERIIWTSQKLPSCRGCCGSSHHFS
jgi:hypothetical protein